MGLDFHVLFAYVGRPDRDEFFAGRELALLHQAHVVVDLVIAELGAQRDHILVFGEGARGDKGLEVQRDEQVVEALAQWTGHVGAGDAVHELALVDESADLVGHVVVALSTDSLVEHQAVLVEAERRKRM